MPENPVGGIRWDAKMRQNESGVHFLREKLRSLNEATLEGEKARDGRVGELGDVRALPIYAVTSP
jgi:hypothetical protein